MKKQIQESELELFREEVQGVSRLSPEVADPYRQKPPPHPRPREPEDLDEDSLSGLSESEIETPEYLLFSRPGIQRRVLADLQRGAIAIELEVDMHGLYAEHARQLLAEFLAECRHRRVRCARIIHGKGRRSSGRQPVLKSKVNYWLRLQDQVLAFCSATQRDGGTGAVYVLLRNPDKGSRRPRR